MNGKTSRRINIFGLLGVLIAVVGILAPILWDLYKERSTIEFQYVSLPTLINKTTELEGFSIIYDELELDQVSKADFILVNSGRTPITSEDLIAPPTITFSENIRILKTQIERVFPSDLSVTLSFDNKSNSLAVSFPLLNPGDYVYFSLLTDSDALNKGEQFSVSTRIIGVREIGFTNKVRSAEEVTRSPNFTLYIIGGTSLLFLVTALTAGVSDLMNERRIKKQIRHGEFQLPKDEYPLIYINFINKELAFLTRKKRQEIIVSFSNLPSDQRLDSADQIKLATMILDYISSATPMATIVATIVIISLFGLVYVIYSII